MKTKILFLLLCLPVWSKAETNVDSIKQTTLKPVVSDFVSEAVILAYEIKTTSNIDLIKEYATDLAVLSDELKAAVKALYPHAPYVDNKHPWEIYADAIAQKANAIHHLCDRSPVKMQKQLEVLIEELREMENF
ncbi:MAG TPA: hypothetical protein VK177_10235 [Flavobacteriales bacterium]|nr:hypothetical protein [Flavobacteriales bacterium]